MEIKSVRDLNVWQQSMALAEEVYAVTKAFPKDETYSLTNQIRRAAVSVASNLAEGSVRRSKPEFARFVNIASGSLAELETQIILAQRIGYVTEEKSEQLLISMDAISKMLFSLSRSLTKSEVA